MSIRRLDADDRRRVANELSKHYHPLEGHGEDNVLYYIVNDKIAPPAVNVADAVSIGDKMLSVFRGPLPPGFHSKMSSPMKTMEYLKRGIKVGEKTVFDTESIFLRILMVGNNGSSSWRLSSVINYYFVQYLYLWLMSLGICGGATRRI